MANESLSMILLHDDRNFVFRLEERRPLVVLEVSRWLQRMDIFKIKGKNLTVAWPSEQEKRVAVVVGWGQKAAK